MFFRVLEIEQLGFEFCYRFVPVVVFGLCLNCAHQVAFAVALHFRFFFVYAKYLADIVIIGRVFQERICGFQTNDKGQYEKTVFHTAKVNNCYIFIQLVCVKIIWSRKFWVFGIPGLCVATWPSNYFVRF